MSAQREAGVIPSPLPESRRLSHSCAASRTGRFMQNAPRSPLEAPTRREIGADPARMSTRSRRVERPLEAVCAGLRGCGGRRGCPRGSTLLCASVREVDPGRNRRPMAGYRGGICADLAHERGHTRLFSRLPGGRPAVTSGANRAEQQWFSPGYAELRQTLKSEGRGSLKLRFLQTLVEVASQRDRPGLSGSCTR